jgi:hypothetical protein
MSNLLSSYIIMYNNTSIILYDIKSMTKLQLQYCCCLGYKYFTYIFVLTSDESLRKICRKISLNGTTGTYGNYIMLNPHQNYKIMSYFFDVHFFLGLWYMNTCIIFCDSFFEHSFCTFKFETTN